jgi:hypothetical protein
MKDIIKNPTFYYIAAPVLAGVWALLAGLVFYPGAVKAYQADAKPEYQDSQKLIEKILTIQPQRLQYSDEVSTDRPFDFGEVVTELTREYKIPTSRYTLNVRGEVSHGDNNARSATLDIEEIDFGRLAQFLSQMLTTWPDLKCEKFSLKKAKTGKDNWNVDLTLTYYY